MENNTPVTSLDNSVKRVISAEEEAIRLRRDAEILIMMDECEKKGWNFDRFITTFAALYETRSTTSPTNPTGDVSSKKTV